MTTVQNVQQRATGLGRSQRLCVQQPPSKGLHTAQTNGEQGSVRSGSRVVSNRARMMRARTPLGCRGRRSWPGVPPGGGRPGRSWGGLGGRGRVEAAPSPQVSAISSSAETGEVP
jgi:hypothetical protein